jgi:hypothetical protein
MPKVKVLTLQTPQSFLAALPDEERRLVLLLGQATNEISTLNRLLLFSLRADWSDYITQGIGLGRSWIIVTLLAGKLWECLVLLDQRINANKAATPYLSKISSDAHEAKKRSNKRRENSHVLFKLRNGHGFHFPKDPEIDAAFAAIAVGEPLAIYLSENGDVTFHENSSAVFMVAATQAVTQEGDYSDRIGYIADELADATKDLQLLFGELVAIILEGANLTDAPEESEIEVQTLASTHIPPVTSP